MKKIFTPLFFLFYISASAQNYFVPNQLSVPSLPSPGWKIEWSDVNADGFKDLVTYEDDGNEDLLVYLNNGGVVDSIPQSYEATIDNFWITDWNQDGRNDVIYTSQNNGGIWVMFNNASGGFDAQTFSGGVNFHDDLIFIDLNADNFPDFYYNEYDSLILVFNNNGSLNVTRQPISILNTSNSKLGDVDGDNDLDLFLTSGSGFDNLVLSVQHINGDI